MLCFLLVESYAVTSPHSQLPGEKGRAGTAFEAALSIGFRIWSVQLELHVNGGLWDFGGSGFLGEGFGNGEGRD